MTTPTNLGNEVVRRLTITERPGYEPDGYGFARRVEDKLFGMALAINKREQERKIMSDISSLHYHDERCLRHRDDGSTYCRLDSPELQQAVSASPETPNELILAELRNISSLLEKLVELSTPFTVDEVNERVEKSWKAAYPNSTGYPDTGRSPDNG